MSTVTIRMVVDALAALESKKLDGRIYLIDDQRRNGSRNDNTDRLQTAVKPGDRVFWSLMPLEIETHVAIRAINVPEENCTVSKHFYPGTDVSYWLGTVKETSGEIPYELVFEIGNEEHLMKHKGAGFVVAPASASVATKGKDASPPDTAKS